MNFERIHVDGFGIWNDLDLELQPGLNVFVAPNEGGKTTLMSFVRAVIFGFERRNSPRRYEPLRGGQHGGHVDVLEAGKRYRLERSDDGTSAGNLQVLGEDGSRLPERALVELLRGTTQVLYQNVFAFGLRELRTIESLRADEVAGHIYSAGMAGSTDPMAFRQRLEDARNDIFRRRGRKQLVSQLFHQIQEVQKEIEELQELPEEHGQLLEQQLELRGRLADADEELERVQARLDAAKRAQRAWTDYEDLLAAESALAALGVPLEMAVTVQRERVAVGHDLAGLDGGSPGAPDHQAVGRGGASARGHETGTGSAAADSAPEPSVGRDSASAAALDLLPASHRALLEEAGRIRTLIATAPRLRELQAAVKKHRQDADAARAALEAHLDDLGQGWRLDRVIGTATGLKEREEARRHGEKIQQAAAEIDGVATRAADAHDAYEAVVARADKVSREAVMLTWAVAAALTIVTSVVVPPGARLVATGAVGAMGAVFGIVLTWQRHRWRAKHDDERLAAAERETTLWAQHEIAEQRLKEFQREWLSWLQEQRLDPDLTVSGALDLLDRIREAQEVARQGSAARQAGQRAREELIVACGRVNALLETIGQQGIAVEDEILDAVEQILGRLESLQAELEAAEDRRIRLRTVLDQHAQARAALRAGAGEEGPDALRGRLESLDPDKIERIVKDASSDVAAARARRDGINEQLGGVAERIGQLESNDELGKLLAARERMRTELAGAVQRWAGLTGGIALFDAAKTVYEEERQPEVLRQASRYFAAMTDGAYRKVYAPLGESRLEVEERRGRRRKGPEILSRGTREQLYLAMRLALAGVYADQAIALPLVTDDILVNFDDHRAAATAALLGQFADEVSQVLAFTCHNHLAAVFVEQAPSARVTRLPNP